MKFYDRERELEALEKTYLRSGSDFIVVSGFGLGYGYFFFR
jgi:AAA+ ATPase superfamily predicted ATPase